MKFESKKQEVSIKWMDYDTAEFLSESERDSVRESDSESDLDDGRYWFLREKENDDIKLMRYETNNLFQACQNGNVQETNQSIKNGARINKTKQGCTALNIASPTDISIFLPN